MKLSQFKQIIKEAVREVVQNEIRDILREELSNFGKILTENVTPPKTEKKPFDYMEMIFGSSNKPINENIQPRKSIQYTNDPIKNMLLDAQEELRRNPSEAQNYSDMGNFTTNNSIMNYSTDMMMGDPDVNESTMIEESMQSVRMPDMPNIKR